MHGTEMVVVIVAMCLGYSLVKHIFTPKEVKIRNAGGDPYNRTFRRHTGEQELEDLDLAAENRLLRQRAEDMMHRINVLEEILNADRKAQKI